MKVVIIEGCDNLGKTTLITNLIKKYNDKYDILVKHSGKPEKCDDPLKYQYLQFFNETKSLQHEKMNSSANKELLVIYDRFVQGEYVWGHLYRNNRIEDIRDNCVSPIVNHMNLWIGEDNIVTILLDAPAEFIYNNDDGKSFCSDLDKAEALNKINKQRDLFYLSTMKPEFSCFKRRAVYDVYDKTNNTFKLEDNICDGVSKLIEKEINL